MENAKHIGLILGVTKSGKYIFQDPSLNVDFKRQDHLDAYNAHAKYLMYNSLMNNTKEQHLLAMNSHYLQAVNME